MDPKPNSAAWDDETCLRFAEGYDREDAAQRGEPSPHDRRDPGYADWAADRIACVRVGLAAVRVAMPAPQPQPDLSVAVAAAMPRAWLDVMGERVRQIAVEGWTPEYDDTYEDGELAAAAAAYAFSAATFGRYYALSPIGFWPWGEGFWKPTTPRRDLVKAGALILAEVERLDRLEASSNG